MDSEQTQEISQDLCPRWKRPRKRQYQGGHVQLSPRKRSPAVWMFRYRKNGHQVQMRIGTIEEYPNREIARASIAHLIETINSPEKQAEIEKLKSSYERPKKTHNCKPEDYERMYLEQRGACAICGKNEERLVVDHCHQTGRLRALLCMKCNSGLGMFQDNPHIVRLAAFYLESHKRVQ